MKLIFVLSVLISTFSFARSYQPFVKIEINGAFFKVRNCSNLIGELNSIQYKLFETTVFGKANGFKIPSSSVEKFVKNNPYGENKEIVTPVAEEGMFSGLSNFVGELWSSFSLFGDEEESIDLDPNKVELACIKSPSGDFIIMAPKQIIKNNDRKIPNTRWGGAMKI